MHFPVMEKKTRKSWEFFQVTSLSPFIHSSQVCYLPPKKGKKNHAFRTAWKVLEYETGLGFFFTCKAMVPVWKWTQIQIDWLILHKLS